ARLTATRGSGSQPIPDAFIRIVANSAPLSISAQNALPLRIKRHAIHTVTTPDAARRGAERAMRSKKSISGVVVHSTTAGAPARGETNARASADSAATPSSPSRTVPAREIHGAAGGSGPRNALSHV